MVHAIYFSVALADWRDRMEKRKKIWSADTFDIILFIVSGMVVGVDLLICLLPQFAALAFHFVWGWLG